MRKLILMLGIILTLTACGMNSEFNKDTKALLASIDGDMKKDEVDSSNIQSEVQLYIDKWGTVKAKEISKDEVKVLNHVGLIMGIATLYSVETDGDKLSELRMRYLKEVESINKVIK